MKKLFTLSALLIITLLFTACSKSKTENEENNEGNTTNPVSGSETNAISSTVPDIPILQKLELSSDVDSSKVILRKRDGSYDGYDNVYIRPRVVGIYSDGHVEELMDKVHVRTRGALDALKRGYYFTSIEGEHGMKVNLDGVISNTLEFDVQNDDSPLMIDVVNNKKEPLRGGRSAKLVLSLLQEPSAEIKARLKLNPDEGMHFEANNKQELDVVFKPRKSFIHHSKTIYVVDGNNSTLEDFTLEIEPLESEDSYYSGLKHEDIDIHKERIPVLYPPRASQLRGALPGASIKLQVSSDELNLKYTMINAPEGMKVIKVIGEPESIENFPMSGINIEWNIPKEMEAKRYNVTVQAEDIEGKVGEVTFSINVPKTTAIKTEVKNNELIVTDKSSRLYGMKMKGHSGEDISKMRLLSVDYRDVWKYYLKKDKEDVPEYTPFVIENMPDKIDIKFPEFMDSYEERKALGVSFLRYSQPVFINDTAWGRESKSGFDYEGTKGYLMGKLDNGNIFLISIQKAQEIN